MPPGMGEAHSKWLQPIGETSLVKASDRHDLPAGTGSVAMEQHELLPLHFTSMCSLFVGRCTGSDTIKACPCQRVWAGDPGGSSREGSPAPMNQITQDAGRRCRSSKSKNPEVFSSTNFSATESLDDSVVLHPDGGSKRNA